MFIVPTTTANTRVNAKSGSTITTCSVSVMSWLDTPDTVDLLCIIFVFTTTEEQSASRVSLRAGFTVEKLTTPGAFKVRFFYCDSFRGISFRGTVKGTVDSLITFQVPGFSSVITAAIVALTGYFSHTLLGDNRQGAGTLSHGATVAFDSRYLHSTQCRIEKQVKTWGYSSIR